MSVSITVAVLAGGQSRRMGQDKSFALLRGRSLIAHVLERVGTLALPTILIANDCERYTAFGLPCFSDVVPGAGSLGGIYSALSASQTDYTLCVACDMPLLNAALLAHLCTLAADVEAVVPVIAGRPQGMHALYHRTCMPTMRAAIDAGELRIADYLRRRRACLVEEDELRQLDPELRSFTNVNTPEDLQRLEAEVN